MKNLFLYFSMISMMLFSMNCWSQQWLTGGNTAFAGQYFGTNNGVPISFRTNNINRMQLTETNTATINGFTVDNSGFLGLR